MRQNFFDRYYSFLTTSEKYSFLVKFTQLSQQSRNSKNTRRQFTRSYFIGTGTFENGSETMLKICKIMFFSTLDLSEQVLRTAYNKTSDGNETNLSNDLRGKRVQRVSEV